MVLGVLPDEKKDNDEVIEVDGHTFIIEEGIKESIDGDVLVDYKNEALFKGFLVSIQ